MWRKLPKNCNWIAGMKGNLFPCTWAFSVLEAKGFCRFLVSNLAFAAARRVAARALVAEAATPGEQLWVVMQKQVQLSSVPSPWLPHLLRKQPARPLMPVPLNSLNSRFFMKVLLLQICKKNIWFFSAVEEKRLRRHLASYLSVWKIWNLFLVGFFLLLVTE